MPRISFTRPLYLLPLGLLLTFFGCLSEGGDSFGPIDRPEGEDFFQRDNAVIEPEFGFYYTHEEAPGRYRHTILLTTTNCFTNGDLIGDCGAVVELQMISASAELPGEYPVTLNTTNPRFAGIRFEENYRFFPSDDYDLDNTADLEGEMSVAEIEEGFAVSLELRNLDEFGVYQNLVGSYTGPLQLLSPPFTDVPNEVSDADFGPVNAIDFNGTERTIAMPFFEIYSPTNSVLYIPVDSIDTSSGEPLGISDLFTISNLHPLDTNLTGRYYKGVIEGATTGGYIDNRYGVAPRVHVSYCLAYDFTAGRTCQVREFPRDVETVIRLNDDGTLQLYVDILAQASARHVINYSGPYGVFYFE